LSIQTTRAWAAAIRRRWRRVWPWTARSAAPPTATRGG